MTHPIRRIALLSRPTAVHGIAIALLALAAVHSPSSRADADVDLAMPGLWKHDVSVVSHGHQRKPSVRWHCMLDDTDPGEEFAAQLSLPGSRCKSSDQQHSANSLSWTLTCAGRAPATANLSFDSNEHYTGSIVSKSHRELAYLEGHRRAACTDPSD